MFELVVLVVSVLVVWLDVLLLVSVKVSLLELLCVVGVSLISAALGTLAMLVSVEFVVGDLSVQVSGIGSLGCGGMGPRGGGCSRGWRDVCGMVWVGEVVSGMFSSASFDGGRELSLVC